jgi:hypothetical protein
MTGPRSRILVLAICLYLPCPVTAQEDPNALFNQALELARGGQTEAAVGLWLQVLDKVEDRFRPSVHRTLGLGYGKMGRYPEAAHHLHRYLETRLDSQSLQTRQKLADIEARLAQTHTPVTIACDPGDAVVHLSEEGTGMGYPCPLNWWFEKGRHAIRVARVGHHHTVTHLTIQEGHEARLHAVTLAPVLPNAEATREAELQLFEEIKLAAGAGQASRLKKLALAHAEVFLELPCQWGFEAASHGMTTESCNGASFSLLAEAGASLCPTPKTLEQAIQLGCPEVVSTILPHLDDDKVFDALNRVSTTYRGTMNLPQARNMLDALEPPLARIRPLCLSDGANYPACQVLKKMQDELGKFYASITNRLDDAALLQVLALRPKLARQHQCRMIDALLSGLNATQCQERSQRLELFLVADAPPCDLRQPLKRLVYHRCLSGLEKLLPRAATEDIAIASREYNEGGRWVPRIIPTEDAVDTKEIVHLGKQLLRVNEKLCTTEGPASPACPSARYLEEQIESINAGEKAASNPKAVLKELCLFQFYLDEQLAELARLKRIEELSGVAKKAELVIIAERIVTQEANIHALAARYQRTARKAFSPKLCQ